MGEFPSGQRGQTVNLLLIASVVRIHLPPPTRKHQSDWCFFVGEKKVDSNPLKCHMPVAYCTTSSQTGCLLIGLLRKPGNRIHLPPPTKNHQNKLMVFCLLRISRWIRTHSNPICRWHMAATSPQPKASPPGNSGRQIFCAEPGQPLTFSKSEAGCLHSGHTKSAGSSSPS